MTTSIDTIRNHHRSILQKLQVFREALQEARDDIHPAEIVRFLVEDLLSHAKGEEKNFYSAVEPLLKMHGRATETMTIDHEHMNLYIERIRQKVEDISRISAKKSKNGKTLLHLVLQLEAILRLHLEKEERVYLPLIEKYLPESRQEEILQGMHEPVGRYTQPPEGVLDIRDLPPRERHPLIFKTFDAMAPGKAFILVNDHDPKPLYYQFQFERKDESDWEYLESGPEIWKVRIQKVR